ncbi:nitroreductase family protein [Aliamphritea ceti]|uniref:nitroreductase family protein n=1 Tax=Aliamphritea ceti TaxID=1524258 RepID=UPI0021C37759|nr:nitroreductase family protein [Aliamphritea ceti]
MTAQSQPLAQTELNLQSFTALMENRISTGRYQSGQSLDQQSIETLIRLTSLSPSAYNLQNWRFIAVQSAEAKARLQAQAYGQPQIASAAVTFIICGTLNAHRQLHTALQPSVDSGILPAKVQQSWVDAATQTHTDNPQLQRDEAFRSASLAAMTLMLAAESMGLAAGPMSGFDAEGLNKAFQLDTDEVPVMLVTVGYPEKESNRQQKRRKPVADVLSYA